MSGRTVISLVFMMALVISSEARSQGKSPAPVVAVFEIENRGSPLSKEEIVALTDYLGTRLGEGGRYQIIPRQEIRKRLVRQKKASFKKCYDQSCQIEVGRELAAQFTVSTSISRVGRTCIVTSAFYDLRKAATTNTASAKGPCTADDLLVAIDKIAAKLEGGKDVKPQTRAKPPVRHVEKTLPLPSPLPPPTAPVRQPRTKNTIVACLLSFFPGGGMYYLEKWVWGTVYLGGSLGGMIAGPMLLMEDDVVAGSVLLALGVVMYPVSIIHTYSAAENWRDPDVERISPGRGFSPVPIGERGRAPHPAVYMPIFSGHF